MDLPCSRCFLWLHAGGTNPGSTSDRSRAAACGSAFPFGRQGRLLRSRSISGLFSRSLHSGLQPPCLRFATAVTGRHARLGSRLLARLCRGRHLRRQTSTRLQGATPSPPSVLEFSERWPVVNTVEANPRPRPTPPNAGDGVPKKQNLVKREPVKKIVTHRAAPTVNNEPAPSISVQAATPVTRMSLLDLLKEKLGQTLFKLN
jgi:hypothetical protein